MLHATTAAARVPVNPMLRGLPLPLSAIVTAALRLPAAVGRKLTLTLHVPPGASTTGQLFVWEKSPGLEPEMAMPASVRSPPPVFVSVAVCAGVVVPTVVDAKPNAAGATVSAGQPVVQTFVKNTSPERGELLN